MALRCRPAPPTRFSQGSVRQRPKLLRPVPPARPSTMARWILVTARGQRACFSRGISGRIAAERVAESAWNQWPNARGMGGRIGVEYAGGLVNDPKDPGGVTKFGISQRSYPNLNIRELTPDDAKAIYQRDYWAPIQGEEFPAGLDLVLLDHAINAGPDRANRLRQGLITTPEDGIMGPVTLAVIAGHEDQGHVADYWV